MQQSKGKNFLKVAGILMIIGGGISIIFSIILLIGGISLASDPDFGAIGSAVIIGGVIGLIASVLELIAGIVGVKNCNKPEKATACIVWGIIVLVLQIVSLISSISGGSTVGAMNIISSIIFGVAIPVLYLIGAFLNKKSAVQ